MTYPGSADALGLVIQDTDGTQSATITVPSSRTYPLGSTGLAPAQPSTWQNVAKGAYPIAPPGAPALGTPTGYTTVGNLTPNSQYVYTLTNYTDYGETIESATLTVTAAQMGSDTALNLTLPAASQGTQDAQIRERRLYRTAAGGSSRYRVARLDPGVLAFVDTLSDTLLGPAAPTTNTSGAVGAVIVTGGGYAGNWVEVPNGATPGAGQFSVDYSFGPTGGLLSFSSTDVGKTISVSFVASTELTSAFFNSQITATKDIRATLGDAPQGTSGTVQARFAADESTIAANQAAVAVNSADIAAFYGTWPNANAAHGLSLRGTFSETVSANRTPVAARMAMLDEHTIAFARPDSNSLNLVDISNRGNPTWLGAYSPSNTNIGAVAAIGGLVVGRGRTFWDIFVIDCSDPKGPSLVASRQLPFANNGGDVLVSGDYALVSNTSTSQVAIIYLGNLGGQQQPNTSNGLYAPTFGGSSEWSATLPATPQCMFMIDGRHAWVGRSDGQFSVVDLHGQIPLGGSLVASGGPSSIAAADRKGYLIAALDNSGASSKVFLLQAQSPWQNIGLTVVSTLTLPGKANGLSWIGDYLVLPDGAAVGQAQFVNISPTLTMSLAGTVSPSSASLTAVLPTPGGFALGDAHGNLYVYDFGAQRTQSLSVGALDTSHLFARDAHVGRRLHAGTVDAQSVVVDGDVGLPGGTVVGKRAVATISGGDYYLSTAFQGDPNGGIGNWAQIQLGQRDGNNTGGALTNIIGDISNVRCTKGNLKVRWSMVAQTTGNIPDWVRFGAYMQGRQTGHTVIFPLGYTDGQGVSNNGHIEWEKTRTQIGLPQDTYNVTPIYMSGGPSGSFDVQIHSLSGNMEQYFEFEVEDVG